MPQKKIKVLICDDSILFRQSLKTILAADGIDVVTVANTGCDLDQKIEDYTPDVLLADPGTDGISIMEKVLLLRPVPVILVLSQEAKNKTTLKAMELGVFDIIIKPAENPLEHFAKTQNDIINKVRAATESNISIAISNSAQIQDIEVRSDTCAFDLIAIGASTGGVIALKEVLMNFLSQTKTPPVVITQHMPAGFTDSFAKRLNQHTDAIVIEAVHGEKLEAGHVYIAPGDKHMEVVLNGLSLEISLHDGPPVSSHKPSVDVLFKSVADICSIRAIGVILTGMGADGAKGLLAMRNAGFATIAQDKATSVVYGMPRVAAEVGAVDHILPLGLISQKIDRLCWYSNGKNQP